jgi:hypothetical protein
MWRLVRVEKSALKLSESAARFGAARVRSRTVAEAEKSSRSAFIE